MLNAFHIPQLYLEPGHVRAVRLYLSELHNMETPVTQAEFAKLFGITATNTVGRYERGDIQAPVMLLRFMQTQIHLTHQLLGLYENEQQSIELFQSYLSTLSTDSAASATPGGATKLPNRSVFTDPMFLRTLYENAWGFGGLVVDGFTLLLGRDPLTITPAFGRKKNLRSHGLFLLDQAIREEGEERMSAQDIQLMRDKLSSLTPDGCLTRTQVVKFPYFSVRVRNNVMTIVIEKAERKTLLNTRFIEAGRQAEQDATRELLQRELKEGFKTLLANCKLIEDTDTERLKNFIGTDKRVKFHFIGQLEQILRQWLCLPTPAPTEIASHKLWLSMRAGETACTTDLLTLTVVGRDLEIQFTELARKALGEIYS